MKFLALVLLPLIVSQNGYSACYPPLKARLAVRALLATEEKFPASLYGGEIRRTERVSVLSVQPHYTATKDNYIVVVRKADCRILEVQLKGENISK